MIDGKKTRYQVSNFGRLINDRGKIIKPIVWSKTRYLMYSLNHFGKKVRRQAHRLTAEYFCENDKNIPIRKLTVNHKDGNKHNNYFKNLEWVTVKENIIHEYENHLSPRGGTPYIKVKVRHVHNQKEVVYPSLNQTSKHTGINVGNLSSKLKRYGRFLHKEYEFSYA